MKFNLWTKSRLWTMVNAQELEVKFYVINKDNMKEIKKTPERRRVELC